ncbi:hypothetical protein GCM10009097_19020 [Pigmentiphaga daeguensis]|jgi:hypothetical protein|uniref:Uncharacterized protein n=1 Tax=Pigmentiphaga daeguensis TaxID=414049 RepID=A0ABN1BRC5_9BURK
MPTQTRAWQGAKHSRGGTTTSIRNAVRGAFGWAPYGQAGNANRERGGYSASVVRRFSSARISS